MEKLFYVIWNFCNGWAQMMLKVLLDLSLSFAKIGVSSLGGGNSMIQLIEAESVYNHNWVSKSDFDLITGASFVFPGLTAVKISALIGYKVAGILGIFVTVLALNLPGLILSVLFIRFIILYQDNTYIKQLIVYLKYGAVALLASATYSILQPLLVSSFQIRLVVYCAIFFVAVSMFRVSPFFGFFAFLALCFIF